MCTNGSVNTLSLKTNMTWCGHSWISNQLSVGDFDKCNNLKLTFDFHLFVWNHFLNIERNKNVWDLGFFFTVLLPQLKNHHNKHNYKGALKKKNGCCNDLLPFSYDISDKSNIVQWYKLNFIEPVIAELRQSPKWFYS